MNNPLQNHHRHLMLWRMRPVSPGHGPKNEPCIYRVMRGSLSADYDGSRAAHAEASRRRLVTDSGGKVVGSELIGQNFTEPQYFHGRVSSIDYNGAGSGQ